MSDDDRNESGTKRPDLRVVQGGATPRRSMPGLPSDVILSDEVPEGVDAIAVEDDTYFVLGADPGFKEPTEHPVRIWTEVHEAEPAEPGSVRIQEGRPVRMHAVIHDLSADPTWREEWVEAALAAILKEVERRSLRNIALQRLGAVHGRLPVERFHDLLEASLQRSRPACLKSVTLLR